METNRLSWNEGASFSDLGQSWGSKGSEWSLTFHFSWATNTGLLVYVEDAGWFGGVLCSSCGGDAGQVQGKLNGLWYARYRANLRKCRGQMVYVWHTKW